MESGCLCGDDDDDVAYRIKEVSSCFGEDLHHGSGVGEEQGHAVGELISDLDVGVLLREFHAVECSSVVREVVLDSGVHHLLLERRSEGF